MKIGDVAAYRVKVIGYRPKKTTSACRYDSGAPYFVRLHGRYRLVAVESGGPNCPHSQKESAARVDTVRSWIRHSMGT